MAKSGRSSPSPVIFATKRACAQRVDCAGVHVLVRYLFAVERHRLHAAEQGDAVLGAGIARAVEALQIRGVVSDGDLVIITKGNYVKAHGGTNTLKIVRVGDAIQ